MTAKPVSWTILDESREGATITLAGLDFGGDGPPVLLHHANGFCAGMWGLVAPLLTARYRVYAMDARGHGDSPDVAVPEHAEWHHFAADVGHVARAIAEEHGVPELPLGIGSSFGGIVSTAAQAARGNLFRHLVLFDPPFHPTERINRALALPPPDGPGQREGLVEMTLRRRTNWPSLDDVRESWKDKPMFAPWQPGGLDLYLKYGFHQLANGEVSLKCKPQVEAHIFATTGVLDPLDFAPRVHVPLEMVRATTGHTQQTFLRALTTLFPLGTYHELDGGHLLPLEAPEACAEFVLQLAKN